MRGDSFTWLALAAFSATLVVSPLAAAQTAPPIGGGYTNAIAIPVDDPTTKNISGALFKPPGAGLFPAVVYMSGCIGLSYPPEMALEKIVIDHLLAKGVATFIIDPFTPPFGGLEADGDPVGRVRPGATRTPRQELWN